MTEKAKLIESTITAGFGTFPEALSGYRREDGVSIEFSKIKDNSLKVLFIFDETSYTREKARLIGIDLIKEISLSLAAYNEVHFTWRYDTASSWKESNEKAVRAVVVTSLTLRAKVAGAMDLGILENHKISEKSLIAFECFNNALKYREERQEKEVAFWLYFAMEALKFEYNLKDCVFKNELVNNIASREKVNAFSYSIGRYYRHFKSSGKGSVLPIKECVDLAKKAIYFYNHK